MKRRYSYFYTKHYENREKTIKPLTVSFNSEISKMEDGEEKRRDNRGWRGAHSGGDEGRGGDRGGGRAGAASRNGQKPNEPKNEILSRTVDGLGGLIRVALYLVLIVVLLNAELGARAAPAKGGGTAVGGAKREVSGGRTLRFGGGEPKKHRKPVNKNCKEYDVTSRAFLADLIFEGTARSRSKPASGRHVTFVIQKIFKQEGSLLRPKMQIRLHFGGKAGRRPARVNPLVDCPSVPARAMANVKVGENYFVFADHFGPMNYTAKGEPIVVNRRNLKSILSVLSKGKEKPPRVLGLQDLNLKTTQQLRLNCQVRGRPVPRINWFKDGAPLIPSSRINVTYYRRNSTVEIKSLELKDGGVYECRATSVTGKIAKTSAHVNVWKSYTPSTTDPEKSFHIKKCSVDAYCLNGGQCYFIEHLGEHMCECEPGFKGARCEIKEVSAIGIKSYVCGFNVGYSSYYC